MPYKFPDDSEEEVEEYRSQEEPVPSQRTSSRWSASRIWTTVGSIVLVVVFVVVLFLGGCNRKPAAAPAVESTKAPVVAPLAQSTPTKIPAVPTVAVVAKAQAAEANEPAPTAPTPVPTMDVPHVNWDPATGLFGDIGAYYFDGDPTLENYWVAGATMTYTCQHGFGIFITMDPGTVQGQSIDPGAGVYVPCEVGKKITLATPHFGKHNQVHVVELRFALPFDLRQTLIRVAKDDGKDLAVMFDANDQAEFIPVPPTN